jgi:hypothetical protein
MWLLQGAYHLPEGAGLPISAASGRIAFFRACPIRHAGSLSARPEHQPRARVIQLRMTLGCEFSFDLSRIGRSAMAIASKLKAR